jgi:hypothetical protein
VRLARRARRFQRVLKNARRYPRDFTFYVADPTNSILQITFSRTAIEHLPQPGNFRLLKTESGVEATRTALAENSFFSVRRFVALLELGELLLRANDVRLVRAAELKELPLPTKV